MTDKQKEAIQILNDVQNKGGITPDQYFLILDFIVENKTTIEYVPQIDPWWKDPFKPYTGGTPDFPYTTTIQSGTKEK